MSYVKARQPVYSMVEVDGSYELAEEIPQDSVSLYTTGLMVLTFESENTAKSYSWEGEENWTIDWGTEDVQLFGERDTLFGTFNQEQFIVSSTLDDRPTQYFFDPLEVKNFESPSLSDQALTAKVKGHYFDKNTFQFGVTEVGFSDTKGQSSDQYTWHSLENLEAVEYQLQWDLLEDVYNEFGMIYFYKKGKQVRGIFYPIIDDLRRPLRKEVQFKKDK